MMVGLKNGHEMIFRKLKSLIPVHPLGVVKLTSNEEKWMTTEYETVNQTVFLRVEPRLRLNVTFIHIYFSPIVNRNCERAFLSVKNHVVSGRFTKNLYCGTYSRVQTFSTSRYVQIQQHVTDDRIIEKCFGNTLFEFSVLDAGLVDSFSPPRVTFPNYVACCVVFKQVNVTAFTYLFVVNKLSVIDMIWETREGQIVEVHDGPGLRSPLCVTCLGAGHHVFTTCSFQAVVTCLIPGTTLQLKNSMKYKTSLRLNKVYAVQNASSVTLGFPHQRLCPNATFCVVRVNAAEGFQWNISVIDIVHTGDHNTESCSLGGLTLFDDGSDLSRLTEISTHCVRPQFETNSLPSKYMNTFSQTSGVILVFYNFVEYLSLNIRLLFLPTPCKLLTINVCVEHVLKRGNNHEPVAGPMRHSFTKVYTIYEDLLQGADCRILQHFHTDSMEPCTTQVIGLRSQDENWVYSMNITAYFRGKFVTCKKVTSVCLSG